MSSTHGIHHITAIAGDPQRNLDFYTGTLGLRLVKRTVNQDDPHTYHLFYADGEGNPGTDLTFFPWPDRPRGVAGAGMAVEVGFVVPPVSLPFWSDRLAADGIEAIEEERSGTTALTFTDPDGLRLALYAVAGEAPGRDFAPWPESSVPEEHQLRGFHVARLAVRDLEGSARFLTETFGYAVEGEDNGWRRFAIEGGGSGRMLEVREAEGHERGSWGPGTVHHVAFRASDDDEQLAVRAAVEAAGRSPTPVIDRFWFHSVYFREPGGVLFEVATEEPGFGVDEDPAELGGRLILPPWLEPQRAEIEAALPALRADGAPAGD